MSLKESVHSVDTIKFGRTKKKMTKRREYLDARNEEIRQLRKDGLTLREIGEKYGVTREAIRLICKGIPKPDLKTYHEKTCEVCNKKFTVPSDRKNNRTCSKECFAKLQKYNNYKNGKWVNDMVDLKCAKCGVDFQKSTKDMEIARHVYGQRGLDPTNKKWYCSRACNMEQIHSKSKDEFKKASQMLREYLKELQ
tara:strand:- start:2509 stop:3093 length:585 start_codon:yes stop_codon:yes gene_type:complete